MWGVKIIETQLSVSFVTFGIYPKTSMGLKGIFYSPFIHKDYTHLMNNTYPLFILGSLLFSSYKGIAPKIFLILFFSSGILLWFIGRPSFHIGASSFIYSLASFIFFSGLIRKNNKLLAISLIVTFLYGSMFWGVLPVKTPISWEGHLSGSIVGFFTSVYYRNQGPKRKKYQWEIDEELEQLKEEEIKVNYFITKKKDT